MNKNQSTLVVGQSGYLRMPTLCWKVSGAMLGDEETSSQGDADMGPDNGQGGIQLVIEAMYINNTV